MPALRTRDTLPRPLELTTDAPLTTPPTLAIIAPTPRAFNFRVSQNLNDSPFSSPSASPFEPDDASRHPTFITPESSTSSSPTALRSLSPTSCLDSTSTTASPSTTTNRRRKSASTSDVERRPKKGDEDYVKRPENAFILFRRKCCEDRQLAQEEAAVAAASDSPTAKKPRQADLSRTISEQWKALPAEERQYWEDKAKEKKKEHEKLYPNYVYRPQRIKDKESKRKLKGLRGEFARITEHENISFVLPMAPSPQYGRPHGRSASAPTPPLPYQSISVPNVYLSSPSCPTSPSLLPLISRRSAHPAHDECANISNFDFVPNQSSINSTFGAGFDSANLQATEYLNMFNMAQQRMGPMSLEPLSLPSEASSPSLLLPAHQIISPCSTNSSCSSSPRFEPYTPTASSGPCILDLGPSPITYNPTDGLQCASDMEFQMGLQFQEQMQHSVASISQVDCASSQDFAWADPNLAWATVGSEMPIGVDDFDLSAIPPVELGGVSTSKFVQEDSTNSMGAVSFDGFVVGTQQHIMNPHPHQYMDEMIIGFDELMAGQGF